MIERILRIYIYQTGNGNFLLRYFNIGAHQSGRIGEDLMNTQSYALDTQVALAS